VHNQNFGNKLENDFVHTHPLTSGRLNSRTLTRKGKTPKLILKNGREVTRKDFDGKHEFIIPVEPDIQWKEKDNGDLVITSHYQPPDFNSRLISRLLCKMALETLVSNHRSLHPFDKCLDPMRKYIRFGPSNDINFVCFAWKKMKHNGGLPKLCKIKDKNVWWVELHFPNGAYLVPIFPNQGINLSPAAQKEWNFVDTPGVFEAEKEEVELNLIKVHNDHP
jgi:hypothetical protein